MFCRADVCRCGEIPEPRFPATLQNICERYRLIKRDPLPVSPQSGRRLTVTTTKGGNDVNQSVSAAHRWPEGEANQSSGRSAQFPATLNPEKSPFRLRFRLGLKLRSHAALYARQRADSVLKYISPTARNDSQCFSLAGNADFETVCPLTGSPDPFESFKPARSMPDFRAKFR